MSENLKHGEKISLNDAWIRGMVESTLMLNPRLSKYDIKVHVEEQTVTLSGEVNNIVDEWLTLELIKGFDVVKQVANQLSVVESILPLEPSTNLTSRKTFLEWYTDINTTADVKSKLGWNAALSGNEIEVETFAGKVILSGEVDYESNKAMAELIISKIAGIKEIENKIVVKK